MKKFFAVVVAALTLCLFSVGFSGCDRFLVRQDGKITIAVLQYAEHGSLDNCYQGLREGLAERGYGEDEVSYTFYNAKGNDSNNTTYANTLINMMPDVAVGIATPSAYALANAARGDVPVVFTAVSDPTAESADFSEFENVTGSSDKLPVEGQIDLIKAFLNKGDETVRIGILYTKTEANSVSQVAEFEALESEKNVKIVALGVNAANEIPTAIENLIGQGVDCFNNLTDNNVVQNLETLLDKANAANIPVFGSEIEQVEKGCLASCSLDYVELGRQTGYMIADILGGKSADGIDYLYLNDGYSVDYNGDVLEKFSLTLPADYSDANNVTAAD